VYCQDCLRSRPHIDFAVRLRSLRLAAGLTQGELARRCGIFLSTIGNLERGCYPRPRTVERLVSVLGSALVEKHLTEYVDEPAGDLPGPKRGRPPKARE
jgi:transcriptional regulator with XRE-family HTH domain